MSVDLKQLQKKLLEMISDFDKFCSENNIEYSLAYGNVLGAVRHKGFIPWDDDIDVQLTRDNYDKLLAVFKDNEKYCLQRDNQDYPLQFSKLRLNNSTYIEDIQYRKKYKEIHQGIFIDIFPVDKVSNNKFQASLQNTCSNILIAQSLFMRGYSKVHRGVKKDILMIISMFFFPFRKRLINYIKKFNKVDSCNYLCSFYGYVKKAYFRSDSLHVPLERLKYENLLLPVPHYYDEYLTTIYGNYMKMPSAEEIKYKIHAKIVDLEVGYKKYLNT